MMRWEYQEEYRKLEKQVLEHTGEWISVSEQPPPEDGIPVYFLLKHPTKEQPFYDVGFWHDYSQSRWWFEGELEGEWNTEFGNLDYEVVAWKLK